MMPKLENKKVYNENYFADISNTNGYIDSKLYEE
jgi:hypothetical protein